MFKGEQQNCLSDMLKEVTRVKKLLAITDNVHKLLFEAFDGWLIIQFRSYPAGTVLDSQIGLLGEIDSNINATGLQVTPFCGLNKSF